MLRVPFPCRPRVFREWPSKLFKTITRHPSLIQLQRSSLFQKAKLPRTLTNAVLMPTDCSTFSGYWFALPSTCSQERGRRGSTRPCFLAYRHKGDQRSTEVSSETKLKRGLLFFRTVRGDFSFRIHSQV